MMRRAKGQNLQARRACIRLYVRKGMYALRNEIFSMEGKNVIFTGGSGWLGRPMTRALLDYGARVAVISRTDRMGRAFDEDRRNGRMIFVHADLQKTEKIRKAFSEVLDAFGHIDVLINGAANLGALGEYRLEKVTDEDWAAGVDGILNVPFRCTREILPYFDAQGGGNIVNIGSMYGFVAPDFDVYGGDVPWNPPSYSAPKAAVIQFTRYCASALARRNIRVNCLSPGAFPNVHTNEKDFIERLGARAMLKRTGMPEDLNGALLLLCSDASSFMTGVNLVVDGGLTSW